MLTEPRRIRRADDSKMARNQALSDLRHEEALLVFEFV